MKTPLCPQMFGFNSPMSVMCVGSNCALWATNLDNKEGMWGPKGSCGLGNGNSFVDPQFDISPKLKVGDQVLYDGRSYEIQEVIMKSDGWWYRYDEYRSFRWSVEYEKVEP